MSDDDLDRLRVASAITGNIPVEVKEIISDWILLTYDIPSGKDGDRVRRRFLSLSRLLGAVAHTESVYLMPWTPLADVAALEVAAGGRAYVWYSKVPDDSAARKITAQFDEGAEKIIAAAEQRMEKIKVHLVECRFRLVARMMEKTAPLLDGLEKMVSGRSKPEFLVRAGSLRAQFSAIAELLRRLE